MREPGELRRCCSGLAVPAVIACSVQVFDGEAYREARIIAMLLPVILEDVIETTRCTRFGTLSA